MIFSKTMLIILIVSLLCCCMGFYRFVWFMSVGYGLSAAGIGACLFVLALIGGNASWIFLLECVVFVIYGIRLGGFLLVRELKNKSYRAKLAEVGGDATVPVFAAFVMWIFMGILYVMESAGPVYRLLNGLAGEASLPVYLGTAVSILGVALEAIADQQKSAAKAVNPNLPAMDGLFKLCRCPNYFGEMTFWTGALITGIGALTLPQWIVALLGWIAIIGIMVSGAKRMEGRHIKHYGKLPEYQKYADTTPILIPLVPLYHMTSEEQMAKEEAKKKAKKK